MGLRSNEAENYDAKHERAALEIVRRVQAKRNVIGLDWIEDEDEDEESEAEAEAESEADSDHDGAADQEEQQRQQQRSANSSKQPSRSVRVLDYACGTGAMSRVRTCCFALDRQSRSSGPQEAVEREREPYGSFLREVSIYGNPRKGHTH